MVATVTSCVYDMGTRPELKISKFFDLSHNLSKKINGIRYTYSLVKQQIRKIKKTTHSLFNVV